MLRLIAGPTEDVLTLAEARSHCRVDDDNTADDATLAGIIAAATAFVQAELAGNDASHDFAHIARVAASALSLAREELPAASADLLEIIELAALLHDIKDWKYSGSDTAGVDAAVSANRHREARENHLDSLYYWSDNAPKKRAS